jgi:hypothetical protein
MNTPNPDDIQANLPERPPAEIQAGRPPPLRDDDPPPVPDSDFKKSSSWGWGWVTWGYILAAGVMLVLTVVSYTGQVTNKTFSNSTARIEYLSSPPPSFQPVRPAEAVFPHEKSHSSVLP